MARRTTGEWKVALKKGSAWGTAVALNSAGREIRLNNISTMVAQTKFLADESIGLFLQENSIAAERYVDVQVDGNLHFGSPLWEIFALLMGDDTVASAGSDYSHVMKYQATAIDLFSTLCNFDGDLVEEVASVKWSQASLKGSSGALSTWTAQGIGFDAIGTGQVNTALSSVTWVGDNHVPFQVVMRINDQSAGSLGSSNVFYLNEFEFSIDRKFEPDYSGTNTLYKTGQPISRGFPEITLTVKAPYKQDYYTIQDSRIDHNAGTAKKIDLVITGNATGNGNNYSITIQLPRCKVVETTRPGQGGNVDTPHTLKFSAEKASAAPTGMTGITTPTITLLNTMATAYDT